MYKKEVTMANTVLGNVLVFFQSLGVYDVLLPFILTFSVMFAILERTKIFGEEQVSKDVKVTKKNLNAMVSFVIGFLVVASSKLVAIITKISSEVIVILLLLVFFMMLVSTFRKDEDISKGPFLDNWWKTGFMIAVAIAMALIALDALTVSDGRTWLEVFWDWLSGFYTDTTVAAIVLIIAVIIIALVVLYSPSEEKPKGG